MTKIRARCPRCGDVEFGVASIVVLTDSDAATGSAYRFDCPECGDQVSRTAVPDVLALLVSAGVREEAPLHRAEPQITEVDVESFRRLLDSEFVWDSLQSAMKHED